MTKRNASRDRVGGLTPPAAPPAADRVTGTLDLAVLAGTLVESCEDSDGLELRLFGHFDLEAARLLQASLLGEVRDTARLDLTGLDSVEPAALRQLVARQRDEHRAGRQLLLRIAPHQVADLSRYDV